MVSGDKRRDDDDKVPLAKPVSDRSSKLSRLLLARPLTVLSPVAPLLAVHLSWVKLYSSLALPLPPFLPLSLQPRLSLSPSLSLF